MSGSIFHAVISQKGENMANKNSTYKVFFRKYGPRESDGQYPIVHEIDKGTYQVPFWVNDPEKPLKKAAGSPPEGYSFDFTWIEDL